MVGGRRWWWWLLSARARALSEAGDARGGRQQRRAEAVDQPGRRGRRWWLPAIVRLPRRASAVMSTWATTDRIPHTATALMDGAPALYNACMLTST